MLSSIRGTDQIFIIDNSKSMQRHRREVRQTFEGLAYLVKGLDLDGIDMYFTNSAETAHGRHRESMLTKFDKVAFEGETYMERTLGRALEKGKMRWSKSAILDRESNWGKSIYVLRDGIWTGEGLCGIPELIKHVSSNMGSRASLGIQFIQFGDDEVGTWRLTELDDGLKEHGVAMDIIDTERHDGNVYKMLLGHLLSSWDQTTTSPDSASRSEHKFPRHKSLS